MSDRLRDGDPELVSQALTTCRRLIDSCADYTFPARDEQYELGCGVTLKVGRQNVLNRLQAFTHARGATKTGWTGYAAPSRISTSAARLAPTRT
ncbi:MAG TPA: hypothetical protein VFJ14_02025 [Nocardioidaceae bacterium]|nr:hypothetical protein [Nocardioidaceae bacterium]